MPWPCSGPKMSVRRIRRSSVPCRRSSGSADSWVDIQPETTPPTGQLSTQGQGSGAKPTKRAKETIDSVFVPFASFVPQALPHETHAQLLVEPEREERGADPEDELHGEAHERAVPRFPLLLDGHDPHAARHRPADDAADLVRQPPLELLGQHH